MIIYGHKFRGNPRVTVSAIAGAFTMSRTSGQTPCFVQASAAGITATGTDRPYGDLEYRWDFGDPTGVENFVVPTHGLTRNSNIQYGPEAGYVYRTAGTYTVTCRARGKGASAFIDYTTTQNITVTAFSASAGEYWFDQVAGNDANDGLSIGSPKQSIAALNALWASNRAFNLKRGSHWTGATGLVMPSATTEGVRIRPYGSGAKPEIEVSSGTARGLTGNNGTGSVARHKRDHVFSDIIIRQQTGVNAVNITSTANATGEVEDIYFDNVGMYCTFGSGMSVVSMSHNDDITRRFGFWGCVFYCTPTANLGSKHGMFGGPANWFIVHGCRFEGGGSNTTLDHHMYMEVRDHAVYSWNEFGNGPGRNYALNLNVHEIGTEDTSVTPIRAKYHNIRNNLMYGTLRAVDSSRTKAAVGDAAFTDIVIEDNNVRDMGDTGIFYFYTAIYYTLRRTKVWDCNNGFFFKPDSPNETMLRAHLYENMIYNGAGATSRIIYYEYAHTYPQQFTDNTIVDMRSDAKVFRIDFTASTAAGDTIDYNWYYTPNDSTVFSNAGAADVNFAAWQAQGNDLNGTNGVDPGWIDPANGIFEIAAGQQAFRIV